MVCFCSSTWQESEVDVIAPAPKLKRRPPRKLAVPWRSNYYKGYRQTWATSYGPGENLGTFSFGADDTGVAYTPPTGYTLVSLTAVTASNQSDLSVDGPSVMPENRIPAGAVQVGTRYAPPVGWWVALIRSESGIWTGAVWISDAGQVHSIDSNVAGGTATLLPGMLVTPPAAPDAPSNTETTDTTAQAGIGFGTIALVAGAGYIIYKLFASSSKSATPRTARARR